METASYEEVAKQLDQALAFCAALGLADAVATSRLSTYRASIDRLIEATRGPRPNPISEQIQGDMLPYLTALIETTEFTALLPFLSSCNPDVLRAKLRDVLRGPELPSEEDENSNQARNVLFELNLASKLWRAGLEPELGEHPDVSCVVHGKMLLIECKRPLSVRGARECVSRARRQVLAEVKRRPVGTRGVIALSLSNVLNRGDKLFGYDHEVQGREGLHQHVREAAARFSASWQKQPNDIIGVIFHVITPAVDRTTNLYVSAQHMNIHPLARDGSLDYRIFRAFGASLEEMWNADQARAARIGDPRS
jgi:hypothetical protein